MSNKLTNYINTCFSHNLREKENKKKLEYYLSIKKTPNKTSSNQAHIIIPVGVYHHPKTKVNPLQLKYSLQVHKFDMLVQLMSSNRVLFSINDKLYLRKKNKIKYLHFYLFHLIYVLQINK